MVSSFALGEMAYDRKAGERMRIGILTLHSQTNYGGVLQAYALQNKVRASDE